MTLLETIRSPRDVKDLPADQLPLLAAEIRDFLIPAVSRNGGHLGPNLGVVELTIALHRVFDSPVDRILFDTGHQAYVHKLLTGRQAGLRAAAPARRAVRLSEPGRVRARLSSRTRTPRPACPTPTASPRPTSCGARPERCVVAVIGDGALTGGMAWEALNNIAGAPDRRVVIVVNDNGRSYQRDDRRAGRPSRVGPGVPAVRAGARLHQDHALAHAAGRAAAVRDAARDQEGPQGRPAAAGAVRGPRPEVPRPGRRPRRAGASSTRCAGPAPSAGR